MECGSLGRRGSLGGTVSFPTITDVFCQHLPICAFSSTRPELCTREENAAMGVITFHREAIGPTGKDTF